jgi:hypothetical protein
LLNGFGTLDGFFSDLTNPYKEIFNLTKSVTDTIGGGFSYVKTIGAFLLLGDRKQTKEINEQEKQTGLLEDLLDVFHISLKKQDQDRLARLRELKEGAKHKGLIGKIMDYTKMYLLARVLFNAIITPIKMTI